jgi:DNA replication protein DnaC
MENPTTFCNRCSNNKFVIKSQDRSSDRFALAVLCSYCKRRCESCGDRGYTVIEKNGYEYVKTCDCQTIPKQISLFNRAHIPAQYASKLFLPFKSFGPGGVHPSQERAFFHVQDWAKGFLPGQKGFVLIGSCGLGKTLLLCQALRILTLTRGEFCLYVEFATLLEDLKEKIQEHRDGTPTESIRETLKDATVLVVDELGKGLRTEWEQSQLDTLISERYYAGKTTLFATNHNDEGQTDAPIAGPVPRFGLGSRKENPVETESLAKRVGQRLYSRLKEFCEFIEIEGDDYRLREEKNKKK